MFEMHRPAGAPVGGKFGFYQGEDVVDLGHGRTLSYTSWINGTTGNGSDVCRCPVTFLSRFELAGVHPIIIVQ